MLGLFDLLVIGGPNQVLLFFSAFILTWLIVSQHVVLIRIIINSINVSDDNEILIKFIIL